MKTRIALFLAICLCLCPLACNSPAGPEETSNPVSKPVFPPKPGEWTSAISIGRFDFTVNPDSTGLSKILVFFSSNSGSVSSSREPHWPITNRSFKIETSFAGAQWTFEGTFADGGDKASGTWKFVASNSQSGSWQAVPK